MANCLGGPQCGNLHGTFLPLDGFKATLVKSRITVDDTTIQFTKDPDCSISCAGFLYFTGCNGGKKELIYYENMVEDVTGNTVTVSNVVRGLPMCGCDLVGDVNNVVEHTISEELLINDTSIGRYWCLVSACLDDTVNDLKRVFITLPSSTNYWGGTVDAPLTEAYWSGKKVLLWNSGRPMWYVYWNTGNNIYTWRPVYSNVNIGDSGVQGDTGIQGTNGTQGDTGIQGDSGPDGALGPKPIGLAVYDAISNVLIGNDLIFFVVPAMWNGWTLTAASATVFVAGTTNSTTVSIYNETTGDNMLTTPLEILTGTQVSTAETIDPAHDDVTSGDIISVNVLAQSTTPARGLFVTLVFTSP
jgi:hypothetical protein